MRGLKITILGIAVLYVRIVNVFVLKVSRLYPDSTLAFGNSVIFQTNCTPVSLAIKKQCSDKF